VELALLSVNALLIWCLCCTRWNSLFKEFKSLSKY